MVTRVQLERICLKLRQTTVIAKELNRQRLHIFSRQLMNNYRNSPPLFVVVLDGGCRFASDLLTHLEAWFPVEIAYVKASSYKGGIEPGKLHFDSLGLCEERVRGRDVVVLEDIIQTGRTIKAVTDFLLGLEPKTLQIAVLINKRSQRIVDPEICVKNVLHPELDGEFYVGFGMDYKNMFRALNHISVLTDDLRLELDKLLNVQSV